MKLLHTAKFDLADGLYQARNQGGAGEAKPPRKYFALMEKSVGHNVKYIVQKFWAPLGKLFAPPGVASLLLAWTLPNCFQYM